MAEGCTDDKGRKADEIRLALVLNGGISLAVWMGGVAHELDLLRRASRSDGEDSVAELDRPAFRIWQKLARDKNKRVLIDVIAGTSAGGLNGMLLATAIGRGAAQLDLRDTWKKAAALENLLSFEASGSLMRGDAIVNTLTDVISKMGENLRRAEPVTLFLTATALDGGPQEYVDGYGSRFDVRDHRRIYRFRHDENYRVYRPNQHGKWSLEEAPRLDFTGVITESSALVQAGRATASFPVAFSPVNEDPMRGNRIRQKEIPSSCVLDGGILNNEPFQPVLDAISERRLDGRLERVLVYVVPSAARVPQEKIGQKKCNEISWVETALGSLNYPRESNFRSGTEDLSNRLRNSSSDAQGALFQRMRKESGLAERLLDQASGLVEEYRRRRAAAVVWDASQRMANANMVKSLVAAPPTELSEQIMNLCPDWIPPTDGRNPVRKPELDAWTWGLYPTERVIRTLMLDLQRRLKESEEDRKRRAACGEDVSLACCDEKRQEHVADARKHLGERLRAKRRDTHSKGERQACCHEGQRKQMTDAASYLSEQLRSTLAVMGAVWIKLGEEVPGAVSDAWVAERACQIFEDLCVRQTLGRLVREAAERYLEAVVQVGDDSWRSVEDVVSYCLAVEVLTHAFAPASKSVESELPTFGFLRLAPDELGPLFAKDPYTGFGTKKLYGVRFKHFGAFVNDAWRASDFAWGRLDAAHHLLRILVPQNAAEREKVERTLHEAILHAEGFNRETMEHNLDELREKGDAALLSAVIKQEPERVQDVVEAVLQLVLSQPPSEDQSATQKFLRKANPYLRAALGKSFTGPKRRGSRLLRLFTRHVRNQLHTRPTPKLLRKALRHDVWWFFIIVALCVGAVLALAVSLSLVL